MTNFVSFCIALEKITTKQMLSKVTSNDLRYPSGSMDLGILKFTSLESILKVACYFNAF
jgi:hypothetical protein